MERVVAGDKRCIVVMQQVEKFQFVIFSLPNESFMRERERGLLTRHLRGTGRTRGADSLSTCGVAVTATCATTPLSQSTIKRQKSKRSQRC